MQVDSGARKTLVKNKESVNKFIPYNNTKKMYAINGNSIEIIGEGSLGAILDKVYVSNDIDSNVIAVKDLQDKNLTTIFPAGKGSGCICVDPITNRTIFNTNNDYDIDVSSYYNNSSKSDDAIRTVKSLLQLCVFK